MKLLVILFILKLYAQISIFKYSQIRACKIEKKSGPKLTEMDL